VSIKDLVHRDLEIGDRLGDDRIAALDQALEQVLRVARLPVLLDDIAGKIDEPGLGNLCGCVAGIFSSRSYSTDVSAEMYARYDTTR
jgi:hypothetical protein